MALGWAAPARAVPGPDSVAVLANANVPESVALAETYADARQVPARQVCAVDAPTEVTISLDDFRTRVKGALETCLGDAGVLDRVEAIVVARGMPLRVTVPTGEGDRRVSMAAALGVWNSTFGGAPMLGEAPGTLSDCGGTSCYAARFRNGYRSGPFEPGWTLSSGTIEWHPMLVTMLHGRSYADAEMLITSAVAAEEVGGADGQFLFMEGANAPRAVLDAEYDGIIAALMDRGYTDAERVPFDSDLTGRTLAAFFTGTASLGTTIEGNLFHPGALVDNLTSFGAVPTNFEETGEQQVSIARWVAQGVGGVHGTTDEPLNNVFPSRWLIVDYVDGSTLAEAYHRRLPFAYWHNLVLGDPMLAPYAVRPEVTVTGVADGDAVDAPRRIVVEATDPEGFGVDVLVLYVDGSEAARSDGSAIEHCLEVPAGTEVQLLAVAQKADDGEDDRARHRPKGWTELTVSSPGALGSCAEPAHDGGGMPASDGGLATDGGAGPDAGAGSSPDDDGCGCTTARSAQGAVWPLALAIIALVVQRGGRRDRSGA